jgi:hypothetical protein
LKKNAQIKIKHLELGKVVQAYNPSTWEAEAERSRVQGQPELHSESISKNCKNKAPENI